MTRRRLAGLTAALLAAGVAAFLVLGAATAQRPAPTLTAPQPATARGDSGTTLTTVTLRNGVGCAVMDGDKSKALACDWRVRGPATGVDPRGDDGTTITLVTLPGGTECAVMDGKPGKALSCEGMS